ncbi:MAG: LD-carboxypeptidase [Calditrichaeota bacterium]|nr:LD-carboxypeptidase [Calditrichota bacterium]
MLKPLQPGATIGICAPAGPVKREKLESGVAKLRSLGFIVKLSPSVFEKHGFLSATDDVRLSELHGMFTDPEVDSVWCARGGVGTSRLLTKLDSNLVANSGKTFLGFSDVTALQWQLWSKNEFVSFTGPLSVEFDGSLSQESEEFSFRMLSGEPPRNWLAAFPNNKLEILRPGARKIIAPLMPGNLTMITTLLGTPWMPDVRGHILVIEDIAEPPYRVDRLLFHLKNAGILRNLAALILGDFGWEENDDESRERLRESVLDAASGTSYPVIAGFPYGHGATRITLPVGSPVEFGIEPGNMSMSFAISPFLSFA